jgi:RNA polymerase sigma factor (sigma-70 family)
MFNVSVPWFKKRLNNQEVSSVQQQEALTIFAQACSTNNQTQQYAWHWLKRWVQKRLYPWTSRYQSISEDLVQEGLITVWMALCQRRGYQSPPIVDTVAYYWQMVDLVEQHARNLSKKELRYWQKHALPPTDNTAPEAQWDTQVYTHAQELRSAHSLESINTEIADIHQCLSILLSTLQRQALWGQKAQWFLQQRFQLTDTLQPNMALVSSTITDHKPYQQKHIAQQLGISQQAVSGYEKRLLQYCQQVLQAYYPF